MKYMIKILTLASAVALFSCNEARRDQEQDNEEKVEEANEEKFDDNESMEKAADFVATAVASDYAEIKLAELAQTKSTNAQVKDIAKMLQAEHSKTLNELKTLASQKAITVPTEEMEDAREDMQKLNEATAEEFDEKWLDKMEADHEKEITKFKKQAENAEDADVKAFASKTLPHLQMHLDKIKSAKEQLDDRAK